MSPLCLHDVRLHGQSPIYRFVPHWFRPYFFTIFFCQLHVKKNISVFIWCLFGLALNRDIADLLKWPQPVDVLRGCCGTAKDVGSRLR